MLYVLREGIEEGENCFALSGSKFFHGIRA